LSGFLRFLSHSFAHKSTPGKDWTALALSLFCTSFAVFFFFLGFGFGLGFDFGFG
jgi:hypothetical protein